MDTKEAVAMQYKPTGTGHAEIVVIVTFVHKYDSGIPESKEYKVRDMKFFLCTTCKLLAKVNPKSLSLPPILTKMKKDKLEYERDFL